MNRDREQERILSSYLSSCKLFSGCFCYDETGSTNDVCRLFGIEGFPEGTLVLAESQNAGRGREGRTFYSPEDSGLYMSLLLRPKVSFSDFGLITACAATSVHQAIQETVGISTQIKWVNDLYYNNKKLCGILAEGHFIGNDAFLVLGIGVNVAMPENGYAPEISEIATSLSEIAPDKKVDRLELCAAIVQAFDQFYNELTDRTFLDVYRSESCVLNQDVTFVYQGKNISGKAVMIDDDARLVVETKEGKILSLSSGEVNFLRPVLSYTERIDKV